MTFGGKTTSKGMPKRDEKSNVASVTVIPVFSGCTGEYADWNALTKKAETEETITLEKPKEPAPQP